MESACGWKNGYHGTLSGRISKREAVFHLEGLWKSPGVRPGRPRTLDEFEDYNLGIRSQPQRWTPGSGAARRENLHISDPAQPVDKLTVHTPRHPTPGDELSKMRVSRQLQRNSGSLRDPRIVRGVGQENAGAVAVEADRMKHRSEVPVQRGIPVRHAYDLQAVRFHFFVAEHSHSGCSHGMQVFAVVATLLMT